jgi:hypothetical protein
VTPLASATIRLRHGLGVGDMPYAVPTRGIHHVRSTSWPETSTGGQESIMGRSQTRAGLCGMCALSDPMRNWFAYAHSG